MTFIELLAVLVGALLVVSVVISGLVDRLQPPQAKQATERVHVGLFALAGVPANGRVLPGIAHEDLVHIRIEQ